VRWRWKWAADNIRVNAVAPTYVRTDLTTPIFSNPELLKTVMGHTPLGRLPEPEDIAAAILFLCSDAARCIHRRYAAGGQRVSGAMNPDRDSPARRAVRAAGRGADLSRQTPARDRRLSAWRHERCGGAPPRGEARADARPAGAGGETAAARGRDRHGRDGEVRARRPHLAFGAISPLTLLPHVGKVPYDALKDIAPLASVMYSPVYLLATPRSGQGFRDAGRAGQGEAGALRVGTSGIATLGHLMVEQLRIAGLDLCTCPTAAAAR
jgi:hypothetical protein